MRQICDIRNTRYLYIDKSGTHFHEKRKKLNTLNIWPTFISIFCDNPTAKHSGTSIWKKNGIRQRIWEWIRGSSLKKIGIFRYLGKHMCLSLIFNMYCGFWKRILMGTVSLSCRNPMASVETILSWGLLFFLWTCKRDV